MITPKEHTKRLCLIPLCKNERFDLVHKFPMDNHRAEEWRRAINLPEINNISLDLLRKRTICSKHFRRDDYKNIESRSLNKTAVPSLNFTKPDNGEKTNVQCQDESLIGLVNAGSDRLMECQIPLKNKWEPVKPSSFNGSHHHGRLLKHVCNANTATVLSEEGPSTKYRVVDSNESSDSRLNVNHVTKALDGRYVASPSLIPVVPNYDSSITLIDQSSRNDDAYADDIIQQLNTNRSYLGKYFFLLYGRLYGPEIQNG